MINRSTRLRWRRLFRRKQKQVEDFSTQAGHELEEHFFARLVRLGEVRRFVLGWILLVVLLAGGTILQVRALTPYYKTLQPTQGGIYTEGILGTFTTANPIYATNAVDTSVSRLLFSGLTKYNSKNQLVNDLAKKIEADERGITYTVTLRDDAFWHDDKRVTAKDVVFTYNLIQNPDAKSPLRSTWQGIKVERKDDYTVVFTLPHPLAAFKNLLTTGVVPEHLLNNISAIQLRTLDFNTSSPVGSGPFKWDSIQITGQTPETREEQIGLSANKRYFLGAPNLDRFIIKAVHTEDDLVKQFENQELTAVAGLGSVPKDLSEDTSVVEHNIPINAETMVFFKTTGLVLQDKTIRQALTKAVNEDEILRGLGYPVIAAKGPLLMSHLGYASDLTQFPTNVNEANAMLDQAGWPRDPKDGIRRKDGKALSFQLYSRDDGEYAFVSQVLQRQWRDIGVKVDVVLQQDTDLQSTIALHNYDALLYGITLGNDPDVYAYWHSSQADIRSSNRLNFSEIKSKNLDNAIEAGRARLDPAIRAPKYRTFQQIWRDEAPAVALYQPRFLYITRGHVYGFTPTVVSTVADRYANVNNWRIRTEQVIVK